MIKYKIKSKKTVRKLKVKIEFVLFIILEKTIRSFNG